MNVTCQAELWESAWTDIEGFAALHYAEVGLFTGALDQNRFLQSQHNGSLVCFTARDEGALVGYWFGTMFHNAILKGQKCVYNHAIYVAKWMRGKGIGKMLCEFVEQSLRSEGVVMVYIGSRNYNDITKRLGSYGYKPSEVVMEKAL